MIYDKIFKSKREKNDYLLTLERKYCTCGMMTKFVTETNAVTLIIRSKLKLKLTRI